MGEYEEKRKETWERALVEGIPQSQHARWCFRCFTESASTMDSARNCLTDPDLSCPLLVLAENQTQGRGRAGSNWDSTRRGFSGTYVFRTDTPLSKLVGYSLVVGVALAQVLDDLGCSVGLKWPNDILELGGKKMGGILIELLDKGGQQYVLTGIGINLKQASQQFPDSAAVFEYFDIDCDAIEFACRLSPKLFEAWEQFRESGFGPFREAWTSRAMYLGERIKMMSGKEVLEGRFEGVTEEGRLLLQTESGKQELSSGHLISIG